ncbi:MAG: cupin domain-containing protein [Acidobacteriota bacterium]|nr:cupin domain-containing protein [Acidobacteriota bacterium]
MQRLRSIERLWLPSGFPGVEMCHLHGGEQGGGSVLMRFAAGASFPAHEHPGGEEMLVLEGCVRLGDAVLEQGDYQWTGPGEIHDVRSDAGALVMIRSGAGIRVIE